MHSRDSQGFVFLKEEKETLFFLQSWEEKRKVMARLKDDPDRTLYGISDVLPTPLTPTIPGIATSSTMTRSLMPSTSF